MPFLPITKQEMLNRGWSRPDFVIVTGDAYVDHPSFGTAIISRVLEDAGFNICILSQPKTEEDYKT
ncbi:MAG: YgiQ family radical SAM protein, partial [Clostridia bacterium]|nr:YgiQ family radical SAM protein [Clostridia bacterium]